MTPEMWQAHAKQACGQVVLLLGQDQRSDQGDTATTCARCHGCHRANACPIDAAVCGRWEGVTLSEVELLPTRPASHAVATTTTATAALLRVRVVDMRTKTLSTVHCGAVCLDRVPVEFPVESPAAPPKTSWNHMWVLTPLAPVALHTSASAIGGAAGGDADGDEAVERDIAHFRAHHERMRQDLMSVCAAAEVLLQDAEHKGGYLAQEEETPMTFGSRRHYPLPMLGGDDRACAVLMHHLTSGFEGQSREEIACNDAETGSSNGMLALFFQDRTTTSAAWEALSVQQTRLAVLRSYNPGVLHPRLHRNTPCCAVINTRGSTVTWTLAIPTSLGAASSGAPKEQPHSWVVVNHK